MFLAFFTESVTHIRHHILKAAKIAVFKRM